MTIQRLGSIFRRPTPIGQAVFDDNRKLVASIDRRGLLRGSLSLGSLVMLTGCDVGHEGSVQSALRAVSEFNDAVQAALFRPDHLAPTYALDQVAHPPRYNAFYGIGDVRPVAASTWKLELAGRIGNKTPWTVAQMYDLPETELIAKHICVEGWDYVGHWKGVSLRLFLERIGADTKARYLAFKCADDYTGSIDMATALHPQTILATRYGDDPIGDPFGFPLRLRTATKLGYKNPKWITAIEVTNTKPGGYWEDRGFNWFGGI
ncbi:molybdopterin-binding protein [Siculibacillus lacustris]|uniref:Molybdopterin-binding protein n=1 Tax=Siculibacillus lacustris TaxID=1549641 RepID=A0A4Q9VF08_9HYPH|nr:molybdopterin-dependent oxidoreductase [Siculibacillus lacustris]TBW33435.1 molybdopterin-binding protein [Siculibacillus lacustris]